MKKLQLFVLAIFCVFMAEATFRPASAQFYPYGRYSNNRFVNSNLNLFFQKRWQVHRLRAQGKHEVANALEGRTSTTNSAPTAAASAPVPLSATSFKPVAAQLMPKSLAAASGDLTPQERRDMERLYGDLLVSYHNLLNESREQRLKHNIAGALKYLIQSSYYVLKDGAEINEAQQEQLIQGLNASLAGDSQFKGLNAKARQELYETTVITSGFTLTLYQEGQSAGDREMIQQAKQLAADTLSQLVGVPLNEIEALFDA